MRKAISALFYWIVEKAKLKTFPALHNERFNYLFNCYSSPSKRPLRSAISIVKSFVFGLLPQHSGKHVE